MVEIFSVKQMSLHSFVGPGLVVFDLVALEDFWHPPSFGLGWSLLEDFVRAIVFFEFLDQKCRVLCVVNQQANGARHASVFYTAMQIVSGFIGKLVISKLATISTMCSSETWKN